LCIDPGFAAIGGPTASSFYWSASAFAGFPNFAWYAALFSGYVDGSSKTGDYYVRAVRAGSCN
jgi:hypothetical protein